VNTRLSRSRPRGATSSSAAAPAPAAVQEAPARTENRAVVTSTGEVSRSSGQDDSSSLGLSAGTEDPVRGPQRESAVTSRDPLRSRATGSSNATDCCGRVGASSSQVSRVVGIPAPPGLACASADSTDSGTRPPSTRSDSSGSTRAHSRSA
jgi:hypothetical protein